MKRAARIATALFFAIFIWVAVGVFSALFVYGGRLSFAIYDSEFFAVTPEKVEITGIARLTREEILLLAGLDRRVRWFDLDEHRMGLFIRSNGWIKECAVSARFPDRVHIAVTEYQPAIVVNRPEVSGERGERLYSIWFADADGTVFKKAFPREGREALPLLFIEDEVDPGQARDIIRQALSVADEWRPRADICRLRSIAYDVFDGFSLECEFPGRRIARVVIGDLAGDDTLLRRRGRIFFDSAEKLRERALFAAEYLFDPHREDDALVAGRIVHYVP